jgi:hypothetical protein
VATTAPAATNAPAPVTTTAPESTAQQVSNWADNGGQDGLNSIVTALGAISTDGQAGNFSAVAQDCQQLSTAIANTQAAGPIPDRRAEKWFAKALALYSEAAAQCTAGADTQDASAIEQATAEMSQGDVYLTKTTRVIKALNGS